MITLDEIRKKGFKPTLSRVLRGEIETETEIKIFRGKTLYGYKVVRPHSFLEGFLYLQLYTKPIRKRKALHASR